MRPSPAETARAVAIPLVLLLCGLVLQLVRPESAANAAATVPSCAAAGIAVTPLGGPNFYIDAGSSPSFRSGYTGYRIDNSTGAPLDDLWVGLSGFTGGSLGLAAGQSPAQRLGALGSGAGGARFWYLTATAASAAAQQHVVTVYQHNPAEADAVALCTTTGGFSSVQTTIAANPNKINSISVSGGAPHLGSQFTVTVTGDTGTIGAGIANDAESIWMSPAVSESWPADAFRLVDTSLTIAPSDSAAAQTYTDVLRLAGLGSVSRPYTATYTFQAVGFTNAATPVQPVQEIASGSALKHTGGYPASIPAITPPVSDLAISVSSDATQVPVGGGDVDLTATVSGTTGAQLDGFRLGLPSDSFVVAASTTWAGQPTRDPVVTGGTLTAPGPFTVGPGSALSIRIHLGATPGTRHFTLLGLVGAAYVGSTTSPIDGTNPASLDVVVAGTAPSDPATTAPSNPVTTAPSAPVTTAPSDPVSTVPSAPVTTAPSAPVTTAPSAPVTTTIPAPPSAQTIDLELPTTALGTDPLPVQATATSGLPVSIAVVDGGCEIVGHAVVPLRAGTCTLEAAQAGDDTWAGAARVRRTVSFLALADDTARTDGQTPTTVDVLANDPAGVSLTSVSAPAHGTARVLDGEVHYVPAAGFRGDDTLSYTAVLDGRSATAHVLVTVADLAPVLADAEASQRAGSTIAVPLRAHDANGDTLTFHATSPDGHTKVSVAGSTLWVTPDASTSGRVAIAVTTDDGFGGTASAVVTDLVDPVAPSSAGRKVDQRGTTIEWASAPTAAASYDVRVDGRTVCRTRATTCRVRALLGPAHAVEVRTLGHDGTTSTLTAAPLRGHGSVLIATVYFTSGSDQLLPAGRHVLRSAVATLASSGFGRVSLDGYTDSDGGIAFNIALSHRRASAVGAFLLHRVRVATTESWHGEAGAVATNSTASGKALNRRVEVVIRY